MQRLQGRYGANATRELYNSHRVTVRLNSKTVNSMTAAVTGHRRRMVWLVSVKTSAKKSEYQRERTDLIDCFFRSVRTKTMAVFQPKKLNH